MAAEADEKSSYGVDSNELFILVEGSVCNKQPATSQLADTLESCDERKD